MARVKYPRALVTRFPRGQTMGAPQADTQRRVLEAALQLFASAEPGEVRPFEWR